VFEKINTSKEYIKKLYEVDYSDTIQVFMEWEEETNHNKIEDHVL